MSTKTLCPEVVEVLNRSSITETLLVLPPTQLERKLYEKVAKVIQLAGGKWNRSKQGFVFPSDPRAKLGLALATGKIVDEKKLRQAFYTPEAVADVVAQHADVEGKRVLEPSAGDGALALACLKFGASQVDCIELADSCRDTLCEVKGSLWITDFLKASPTMAGVNYERIVMNPPFTKGQDVKHVTHAKRWLAPGGKLYAIVPDKDCPKLAALGASTVRRFPSGAFKESGTGVATRLILIEAPADGRPRRRTPRA